MKDITINDLALMMKKEFDFMHKKFDAMNNEFTIMHNEFNVMHNEFDYIHREFGSIHSKLSNLTSNTQDIQEVINRLEAEVITVKSQLSKLESKTVDDVDALSGEFVSLKEKIEYIESELNILKTQNAQ